LCWGCRHGPEPDRSQAQGPLPRTLEAQADASVQDARRKLTEKSIPFTKEALGEHVKRGNEDAVRLFLAAGMNPNTTYEADVTALMEAVKWSHRNLVELLIQKGADLNAVNVYGETALIVAIRNGANPDLVTLLLEKGANPNGAVRNGNLTPLLLAVESPDIVEALLKKGADVTQRDTDRGETALSVHAQACDLRCVKLLLSYGADPNSANIDGYTD